jgi:phage terminase small subunit
MDQEKTIEEIIESLEPKQKLFVEIYVGNMNGAEAARNAGYSPKCAKETASTILTYPNVAAYLSHLQRERSEKLGITHEEMLEHLNILRRANIKDYVEIVEREVVKEEKVIKYKALEFKAFDKLTEEQTKCIESVKNGPHGIELKLHGKDWTIEKINKHIGFYEKDNKQKPGGGDAPFSILFSTDETKD